MFRSVTIVLRGIKFKQDWGLKRGGVLEPPALTVIHLAALLHVPIYSPTTHGKKLC